MIMMIWALAAAMVILIPIALVTPSRPSTMVSIGQSSDSQARNSVDVDKKAAPIEPITLERIFDSDHQWTATLSARQKVVMIATGDVIPARVVNVQTTGRGDFRWPYEKTAEVTRQGDVTLINLETPLIDKCLPTNQGMVFCSDQRNVEGLVFAGVDIASLANNHAGNRGKEGVEQTAELLGQHGIATVGVGEALFKQIKQTRFVFLAYNDISKPQPGVANVDEEKIKKDIADAAEGADVVVVSFHWGAEYRSQPDARQRRLAHLAADSGADVIIGNHPHWIQPVEIYKGKLIAYAHGNLVFDQMWSLKTREGVVGRYTFYGEKLIDLEFLPVRIEDYGQPRFMEDEQKALILRQMAEESGKLSSQVGI